MMISTPISLANVQLSRNTLSEIQESSAPVREAALEAFRRRNATLDAVFYDVGRITENEGRTISPWLAREGALLIVPPSGSGELRLCSGIDDFIAKGGQDVRILTVAGVGSSALGSAAFARNVADAFGAPAAAVVSGYGLSDLLTEAAGGWFWFGGMNRMRGAFEQLDNIARQRRQMSHDEASRISTSHFRDLSLDTATVYTLLGNPNLKFSVLTGHSKGNLVISEALFELEQSTPAARAIDYEAWLITVSAAIFMPKRFKNIIDVMGDIDWFGAMNSRGGVQIEKRWRSAWHHTNTELPFHLPVTKCFQEIIKDKTLRL